MTHHRSGPAFVHHGQPPQRSVALDLLLGAAAGAAGVWAMDRVGWFLYNQEDRGAMARELQARKGLASGPREYPWQAHARGAVAHAVLGVVTEGVLRLTDHVR